MCVCMRKNGRDTKQQFHIRMTYLEQLYVREEGGGREKDTLMQMRVSERKYAN